jgi:hypothetical protein
MRKQRTFYVKGQKIQIISSVMTSCGNFAGFKVKINGDVFKYFNALSRQESEDKAYVKWVQSQPAL